MMLMINDVEKDEQYQKQNLVEFLGEWIVKCQKTGL